MFVLELAFMVLLFYTKLISVKYIGIIAVVLLIMLLLIYVLVRKIRKNVRFAIGVVLAIIVASVLGIGSFYIYKTVSALGNITGVNKETTEVNVYVKQDDAAQSLSDASSYTFGIMENWTGIIQTVRWIRFTTRSEMIYRSMSTMV